MDTDVVVGFIGSFVSCVNMFFSIKKALKLKVSRARLWKVLVVCGKFM